MEDNGEYKAICSLIDNIERNLTQVQNVQNEQNFEFIRREIEEHFERCVHALEARCQQLIDELTQIFVQEAPVDNLLAIYNKCIEIKELGIGVFKIQENIAELTWKEAQKIVLPSTNTESIEVDFSLPKVILSTISVHGTVTLKNPGSKISTTSCYSNTNSTEKLLEHIAQIQDNVIVLQTFANNFQTLQESEESKNKMMATMETTLQLVKIVLQLVKDVVPTSDTDEYKKIYKELDNKKAEIAELKVAHATERAALQKVIDMQCEKIDSAATQISQLQREKQQLAEQIGKFMLEKIREGIESNAKKMADAAKHELVISKEIIRLKMEADRIQQAHELEEKQWKHAEALLKKINEQREKISGSLAQQAENNTAHNKENLNS